MKYLSELILAHATETGKICVFFNDTNTFPMPVRNASLEEVIRGCLKRKRKSQRRLYEIFYGYSMNICLRYSRNKEDAEEILNDGFMKVFQKIDQYNAAFEFKSWLRKILVNSAIDSFRKNRHHIPLTELHDEDIPADDFVPMMEAGEDPLPVIQQLSPQYRMVFNLYVMEEYSHAEIAERLNISLNTSRSNLMRAKLNIKKIMIEQKNNNKRIV